MSEDHFYYVTKALVEIAKAINRLAAAAEKLEKPPVFMSMPTTSREPERSPYAPPSKCPRCGASIAPGASHICIAS